ncbi:PREDICTED: M-phase phosphoprotein 6 [Nicrophorus vespilloides]|uniref:M-phase phosphoprotein 6 n=1 Tax=Nicrophorus vespilloides TaxID=110193 RepID=A0ABM1NJK2_NICVS|nr:PREDICTED: M-phase phosphoprotein 6 [Nicrophorus vespilloides]
MGDNSRTKLSKSVLDMKFMKKTKDRVEKEADDAEGNAMYSSEITEDMKKSGTIFVNTSIMNCRNLIEGRLSFGGMNPDIEKIMSDTYVKQLEDAEKQNEKDVSDQEMAEGYSTLNKTMAKKFQTKKARSKKFMKPKPMD